jgi:hypothetical protein
MLVEIQQSFLQYHRLGKMHSCSALIMGPGEVGIKGFRGLWLGFSLLSQTEGGIAVCISHLWHTSMPTKAWLVNYD